MQCPKCGGPTWDNRTSKRKPNHPDYKCKNRECDGAVWEKPGVSSPAPSPTNTPMAHSTMQKHCVQFAIKEIAPLLTKAGYTVTAENVLAAAATLMINGSKGGQLFPPKAPAQPAPPPPPPPPVQEQSYHNEDDLPF